MLFVYTVCVLSLNTLTSSSGIVNVRCKKNDKIQMKAEFKNCTSTYKEEYNLAMREDDIDEEEVTCRLVEYIVEKCGDLWSKCHTEEDVRRMKDMQVESLLIKNREALIDIEQCPTAKKIR